MGDPLRNIDDGRVRIVLLEYSYVLEFTHFESLCVIDCTRHAITVGEAVGCANGCGILTLPFVPLV